MAVWGFNLSAIIILVKNVEPIILTAARIFVSGISVLIISKIIGIFLIPTKKELITNFIIMVFNVVLRHSFLAIGLTMTTGVNAGIILGSAPLITMVLSIILLKDIITRLRVFGFMLGFICIIITSIVGTSGLSSISLGDIFIFLSIFAQAVSFILISKLNPTFDPRILTGYMLVIGSFFIFIISLIDRKSTRLNSSHVAISYAVF